MNQSQPDYAMRTLLSIRDKIRQCKTKEERDNVETFYFFQIGGSGQCYSPAHVEIMREIKDKCRGFTGSRNKYRDTSLILAAIHKDYEFVKFLMENGADPFEQRYNMSNAFDYCDKKSLQIIKEELDR